MFSYMVCIKFNIMPVNACNETKFHFILQFIAYIVIILFNQLKSMDVGHQ